MLNIKEFIEKEFIEKEYYPILCYPASEDKLFYFCSFYKDGYNFIYIDQYKTESIKLIEIFVSLNIPVYFDNADDQKSGILNGEYIVIPFTGKEHSDDIIDDWLDSMNNIITIEQANKIRLLYSI